MNIPLLIASLIGSSVLLTCLGISSHLRTRKTINERLKRVMSFDDTAPVVDTRVGYATPQGPVVRFLGALGEANKPQSEEEVSDVRRRLIQAGYRGPDTPLLLFGAKLCLAIVLAGVFALIRAFVLTTLAYMHTMLFFVLAAVVGFPDALDLMVVCVEAGLGLDAAISRVGEELQLTHPVLSEEFKLLKLELQVGVTRE